MQMKEKIEKILKDIGLPYQYHHFEEEEAVAPPFLVYLMPNTNNLVADDEVYFQTKDITIELYFDKKDLDLEKKIESSLKKNGIIWNQTEEIYIDSEKLFVIYYEFSINESNS